VRYPRRRQLVEKDVQEYPNAVHVAEREGQVVTRETSIQLVHGHVEQAGHGRAGPEATSHLRRRIKGHAERGWSGGNVGAWRR
jgi:hypothetical protein